jgi:hypothetical protein
VDQSPVPTTVVGSWLKLPRHGRGHWFNPSSAHYLTGSKSTAPIDLDGAQITGSILLTNVSTVNGGIRLVNATTGGNLDCDGGHFDNKKEYALNASRAKIGGGVFLRERFVADGEVRLVNATIDGNLSCRGGTFSNDTESKEDDSKDTKYALDASRAKIGGSVLLTHRFKATGEVRLLNATIDGDLDCEGGTVWNKKTGIVGEDSAAEYALNGSRAKIGGSVFLRKGFAANGEVRLVSATIDGQLNCNGGRFSNPGGVGFELREASVAGGFYWNPKELEPLTEISLIACSVGVFEDDIDKWPESRGLKLHGFTYDGFGKKTTRDASRRILWLHGAYEFHSQPYEQLAKVYRATGRTVEARKVSIAREWARTETLGTEVGSDKKVGLPLRLRRSWSRFWHRLWGWTTSFGFEPARALWIFAFVLMLATVFFWWAGQSGVMEPTDLSRQDEVEATECNRDYPCYQPFVYAADVMVPIVDFGQRDAWTPDVARAGSDVTGWWGAVGGTLVRWVTVLLVMIGWVLTAAFIAAVGSTISRS